MVSRYLLSLAETAGDKRWEFFSFKVHYHFALCATFEANSSSQERPSLCPAVKLCIHLCSVSRVTFWLDVRSFKVKLFLRLINYLSTMPWRHMGEWRYSSIILEVTGQLHAPADLPPGTHWIRGWVGPSLDAVEKRKILHCRESNTGRPDRSPSLYRLSYPDSSCVPLPVNIIPHHNFCIFLLY
jgi:hypothetical protein